MPAFSVMSGQGSMSLQFEVDLKMEFSDICPLKLIEVGSPTSVSANWNNNATIFFSRHKKINI